MYDADIQSNDIVLQGYGSKIGSTAGLFSKWEKKYFILYPNRLEWADNLSVSVQYMYAMYMYIHVYNYTCETNTDLYIKA